MTGSVIKYGNKYRLQVGDGQTTENFNPVGGEGTLTFTTATDKIDISSKDDGAVKSVGAGQSEISIDLAGVFKSPDVGIAALRAASTGQAAIDMEVIDNSTTPGTVVYKGSFYVFNMKMDLSHNQAAKYSLTLMQNGPATTDTLFS